MNKIINEEILTQECKFLKNKNSKIIWCITFSAIVSYLSIKFGYIEILAVTIPIFLLCLAEYMCTKQRLNSIELILFSRIDDEDVNI